MQAADTQAHDVHTPPRLLVRDSGNITHVTFPRNEIDGIAVRQIFEAAAELTNGRNACMLVDLTDVSMASSGLMGILVAVKKKFLHVGGQLHVAVTDPQVMTQFELMNLQRVLRLFTNVDEAAQQFKA